MSNEVVKNKKPVWVKIVIIILSVVLSLSALLLGGIAYFRLSVKDYYDNSGKAFEIPDLNSGFVPQGFCYDQNNEWFLTTGYMQNGTSSPIYIVDNSSKKTIKTVYLQDKEGKAYSGHCGGIAFYGDYVYIADGENNCLVVFDYNQIKTANNDAKINALGTFSTKYSDEDYVSPSCVEVYGNKLIVGEFYRKNSYPTPSSHHLETPSEDTNTAIALEFTLYNFGFTSSFGINPTPQKAYSLPSQVQGLTFYKGNIFLSTSWGLAFSKILVYDSSECKTSTIKMFDTTLPLTYLDSSSLIKTITAPPMSEEMVILDNNLFIMNESASNKYIFGKFTGGNWCYATYLDKYGFYN